MKASSSITEEAEQVFSITPENTKFHCRHQRVGLNEFRI